MAFALQVGGVTQSCIGQSTSSSLQNRGQKPSHKFPSESVALGTHWSGSLQPLESIGPGHNSWSTPHTTVQETGQSSPVLSFTGPFGSVIRH